MIQSLAADSPAHKRRSSVSELAMLSMSSSFLDTTNTDKEKDRTLVTPENSPQRGEVAEVKIERTGFDMKSATPRQQVVGPKYLEIVFIIRSSFRFSTSL